MSVPEWCPISFQPLDTKVNNEEVIGAKPAYVSRVRAACSGCGFEVVSTKKGSSEEMAVTGAKLRAADFMVNICVRKYSRGN